MSPYHFDHVEEDIHDAFIKALQDGTILSEATEKDPDLFEDHKNQRDLLLRADLAFRKIVPKPQLHRVMTRFMDKIAEVMGLDEMHPDKARQVAIPIQMQQEMLDDYCKELKEIYR